MSLLLPLEKQLDPCPAGAHSATCRGIIDLGTQPGKFGPKHQVWLEFELQNEHRADGRPHTVGRRCNFSSDRKSTLREIIESWLGRVVTAADLGTFDLGSLLGASCLLFVKHTPNRDGRVFANITSVMAPQKGTPARASLSTPGCCFSLSDRPFAQSDFDALPGWQKELIQNSPEYREAVNPGAANDDPEPRPAGFHDDDIPF